MRLAIILASLAALAACASTEMRPYIGQPIEEVLLRYGAPEQVIDMGEGRRAYQFRWGGGAAILPGSSVSTGTTTGGITTVNTTSMPGMVVNSPGCLMAFIASDHGGGRYVVDEIRPPSELAC